MGPSIQIYISDDKSGNVELSSLLGEQYGSMFSSLFDINYLQVSYLLSAIPIALVTLALIRTVLTISQWYLWEFVSELAIKDIRSEIVSRVIHSKIDDERKSELDATISGVISYDCRKTKDYFVRYYGGFPRELSQCIFYSVSLYLLSSDLFSVFFIALIPAIIVLGVLGRRIRKKAKKLMHNYSEMSEWLQQRLLGVETIKAFRSEAQEIQQFEQISSNNFRNFLRITSTTAKTSPILEFIAVIAMVMVLYVSLIQVEKGVVTGAVVLSFFSVVASLSQSASKLGKYFNASREGRVALTRIESLLKITSVENPEYRTFSDIDELVRLDDVKLSFNGTPFFKGLDLKLEENKSYALVGPSGSGKSTLISLILGVIKADSGKVMLTKELGQASKLVTVPQKLLLSPDGIDENVSFPNSKIYEKRSKESLLKLFSNDELEKLYSITDIDTSLSGGQEQRVLLSRLFYHDPVLSVIDEGTSALDMLNEEGFYKAFQSKLKEKGGSSLYIAHRPKALQYCDEVIHLEDGEIRFQGGVSEYEKSPLYKRLFERMD